MRYLDRGTVANPECLTSYDSSTDTWDNFGADCKTLTRAQLVALQGIPGVSTAEDAEEHGVLCAYCEGAIRVDGHIEHFRRRSQYQELTFEWTNLFLACGSQNHCGHYKDGRKNPGYNPDDLIKPDTDDPAAFLFFSTTGDVSPRSTLDAEARHRADETIRVFNLNEPSLVANRRRLGDSYLQKVDELIFHLQDLEDDPDSQAYMELMRAEIIQNLVAEKEYAPYACVIRELLRR